MKALTAWLSTPQQLVVAGLLVGIAAGVAVGWAVGSRHSDELADRAALSEALLEKGQTKLEACEAARARATEHAAYYRGRYDTLDSALRFARSERAGGGIGPVGGR